MGAGGGSLKWAARTQPSAGAWRPPGSSKRGNAARSFLWQNFSVSLSNLAAGPAGGAGSGAARRPPAAPTLTRRLCRSRDRTPHRRRYRDRRGSDACRFEERSPSCGEDCCPPRARNCRRSRGREQHRARQHQHRCRKRRTRSCSSASSVSSSRNERGVGRGPNPSSLLSARSAPGEYLCPPPSVRFVTWGVRSRTRVGGRRERL